MKILDRRNLIRVRGNSGFTLVEMLVSITIFSFALSALVSGLYVSTRTWRNVRLEQEKMQSLERALARITHDFRQAAIISDKEPAWAESRSKSGGEALSFTVLSDLGEHPEAGFVWARIEYFVQAGKEDGASILVRSVIPQVSGEVGNEVYSEEILLENIHSIRYDYSSPDGPSDAWKNNNVLPAGVTITLSLTGGETVQHSVAIPAGLLQGMLNG